LEYIAILLRYPLKEIAARSLRALSSSTHSGTESNNAAIESEFADTEAGSHYERLDAKAVQQYKNRALEIKREIDDARELRDNAKIEKLIQDLEFIKAQLSADTGLRGKPRKFADDNEKARICVTNSIQRALQKIEETAPKTASHLRSNISTGTSLMYRDKHTCWKL
jgi:hypothetical protein